MPQHPPAYLQYLPLLIVLPILFFRLRKLSKPQPLKLGRLWIRPALLMVAAAVALFLPQPGRAAAAHLAGLDWALLAVAFLLGAAAGWQWGRTMQIEVHPENGTLMAQGGQAAILVLVVLVVFRLGLRTGLEMEASAWHLNVVLIADAFILFSVALFGVRSLEMYLRARKVMAGSGTSAPP